MSRRVTPTVPSTLSGRICRRYTTGRRHGSGLETLPLRNTPVVVIHPTSSVSGHRQDDREISPFIVGREGMTRYTR